MGWSEQIIWSGGGGWVRHREGGTVTVTVGAEVKVEVKGTGCQWESERHRVPVGK